MDQRSNFLLMAIIAEQEKRYDDSIESMKKIAKMDKELSLEEIKLLHRGYKYMVTAKRESWRKIYLEEKNTPNEGNQKRIEEDKLKIENVLTNKCEEVLSIITSHLIPRSSTFESSVFLYTIKGDYYRYLAEIKVGDDKIKIANLSLDAYKRATDIAKSHLKPLNCFRLGVAVNLSVLHYELLGNYNTAYSLLEDEYDEAKEDLSNSKEEEHQESIPVLRLMEHNMVLWSVLSKPTIGYDYKSIQSYMASLWFGSKSKSD